MNTTKLTNISTALTLRTAWQKGGRNLYPQDLDALPRACIVYGPQKILWVGPENELPSQYQSLPGHDCKNHIVTPEIVDCHTHLIFGGNRAQEYTMRLNGADYEEIAKAGGGILATVKGTNELSSDKLFTLAKQRCERLYSYGVGTIEIKSGYGLNFAKEYEISHVIHELKRALAPQIQIHNTFMAAHAVPQEFSSSTEYLKQVVLPLFEKLSSEGIIDSVDIFHERGYFNGDDMKLLFSRAKNAGVPRRCHADEFDDNSCDVRGQESSDYERVTRVGRLIRKLSLDELPQLMNILKGEMSLVGPRPLLMEYLSLYNERQRKRHHALPGITGWAQVNGRNSISHEQKFELDVWYVENWSFGLDLKILILTLWKVFQGKGVNLEKYVTMSRFEGETKDK